MRVLFMGTPQFAVPSLEALAQQHEVVAVFTRPDAVSGRGGATRPSPVRTAAEALSLNTYTPATLRSGEVSAQIRSLAPDVIVVVAFGAILPADVLSIPRLGCVNVHASLLPRWRGAAPIQRAVLAGDALTGVSIMRMDEGLDTGPVCLTYTVEIDSLSAPELTTVLAERGAHALLRGLELLERGECEWVDQAELGATYADKVTKSDVALKPSLSAAEIVRRVRASTSAAPSRTVIDGHGVTVLAADEVIGQANSTPLQLSGSVQTARDALLLGAADGVVAVRQLKPDGKGEMDAVAWARGRKLTPETRWGTES